MSSAKKLYGAFRRSDGRIKLMTLLGVSGVVAIVAMLMVMPAFADIFEPEGAPSGEGVQPVLVSFGGGAGACSEFGDEGLLELHINNPTNNTTYTGPDGTNVKLLVNPNDTLFSYQFVDQNGQPVATTGAFDIIVNGGAQNTWYDIPGGLTSDSNLHAPVKGGSYYKLSHINFCYGELPLGVSGKKFHDRDTDGSEDPTFEEGLGGFTITAFQNGAPVASVQTQADTGSYTFEDLAPGDYLICEAITDSGLPVPTSGPGYTWMWRQSTPSGNTDCDGLTSGGGTVTYESAGHMITVDGPIENVDFGNHIQVGIYCGGGDVTVELGGTGTDDTPRTTVEIPADSPSCIDPDDPWIVTLDVGLNADPEAAPFSQFVVFGDGTAGNPDLTKVITQTIEWDAEEPDYSSGDLSVPTTRVSYPDLADIAGAQPVERCNDPAINGPSVVTPVCLESRTIQEGGVLGTKIQVTEVFKLLGDPGFFR